MTNIPAFTSFGGNQTLGVFSPLFPMLFVTIACGTISGFHSLVSSGTTSKQLNKETDARLIGYGGMLGEGLLATLSLSAVAVVGVTASDATGGVGLALPKFAKGGGIFLSSLGIPASFGAPFMALVMVSFLLTSTDTALRLGRYLFEEIVARPRRRPKRSPRIATSTASGSASSRTSSSPPGRGRRSGSSSAARISCSRRSRSSPAPSGSPIGTRRNSSSAPAYRWRS